MHGLNVRNYRTTIKKRIFGNQKRKGFLKTLEAVIAGLMLLMYMNYFSAAPLKIKGTEARNYMTYSTLLMATTMSDAQNTLYSLDEDASSRLLRILSGRESKIKFYLNGIPRKYLYVGFLLPPEGKFSVSLNTINQVPCSNTTNCTAITGKCIEFDLDGNTAYFVNESVIALLNESGLCDPNRPDLMIYPQMQFEYGGHYYKFLRKVETGSRTINLDFLKIDRYVAFHRKYPELSTGSFYLNGKDIHIYFDPITYQFLTPDLDAVLIFNRSNGFSPEEVEALREFAEKEGGILWVADVNASFPTLLGDLVGVRWNGSYIYPGSAAPSIFNYYLSNLSNARYIDGYEVVEYFEHLWIGIPTHLLNLSAPGVNISCIVSGNTTRPIRYGWLNVSGEPHAFIVLNESSPVYNTLYIAKHPDDLDLCDAPNDYIRVNETNNTFWLNVSIGGQYYLNNITLRKIQPYSGSPIYFTFNRTHVFRDLTPVEEGYNAIIPIKNDSTRLIVHSLYDRVADGQFPAPVLILQEINNTYRSGWMTAQINGTDEEELFADALLWVMRKHSYKMLTDRGYQYSFVIPVAWINETKLIGSAEIRVW